mmetsp:Transcript_66114/g.186160  ORF Transcript_66114/g.186160 Transcript_66114/m.186160 type:complete len:92 (+) Transcript_66114:218-493(+)
MLCHFGKPALQQRSIRSVLDDRKAFGVGTNPATDLECGACRIAVTKHICYVKQVVELAIPHIRNLTHVRRQTAELAEQLHRTSFGSKCALL